MAAPLDGTRVVDLTDIRGALCSRILADLGADVIRVMPPGYEEEPPVSHEYRNANKRGTTLDVHSESGRAALEPTWLLRTCWWTTWAPSRVPI